MKIGKGVCFLIVYILATSCYNRDKVAVTERDDVKYKANTRDVLSYQNAGIKDSVARVLFAEGLEKVEIEDFEKARKKFIEASRVEPRNPILLNAIAQSEVRLGNIEKSNEISLQILAIDSLHVETYSNLGLNYMRSENYDKAVEILSKGLKFTSDKNYSVKSILVLNLAISYYRLGDCASALKYANEVLRIATIEGVINDAERVKKDSEACL